VTHRCQRQLQTPAVEEWILANEQGIGALVRQHRKGRIDLAAGAGVDYLSL
jgi:hypothetical protein